MQLRARPAWPGVTHLPEVIFHIKRHDAFGWKMFLPDRFGFKVRFEPGFFIATKVRRIKPLRIKPEAPVLTRARHHLPCPRDGVFFEVIAEGPVAQHLEEGVVVGVHAHLFQVVVLALHADALLRVHGAAVVPRARSKEHVLELVHSRVHEQQGRIVLGEHRRGGHHAVLLGREKV